MSIIREVLAGKRRDKPIDDLKSVIGKRQGLARQNRFMIFMTPPTPILTNLDLQGVADSSILGTFKPNQLINDPRDIAMLCDSCSLPQKELNTVDYQTYRQTNKFPVGYNVNDVDFVFKLTNDYFIKKLFDRWMNLIVPTETYKINYRDEYACDVIISQLNEQNIPVYSTRLINAYPIVVNAIELNNASADTIQQLTVSFTFEDFKPEYLTVSAVNEVKNIIGGLSIKTNSLEDIAPPSISRAATFINGVRSIGSLFGLGR